MNQNQWKIINYYKSLESRLGYTFLTWDTKHFGYYPSKRRDISEKKAQILMMDLVAQKLELKNKDFVLDAGCGRGTTSLYLAQKYGCKIIGIDIVKFELDIGERKKNQLNLIDKVNFYLKDYSDTKFPNNYFDKIFTLETLVHSPNIVKTLKEFYRILKPDGKFVLFEYSISSLDKFDHWERKMLNIINEGSAMISLGKMFHNKFPLFIKQAGFKIISDEDITEHMIPSAYRFNNFAKIPYIIIKLLNLQKYFINTTAGVEFYKMLKKKLGIYRVILANK